MSDLRAIAEAATPGPWWSDEFLAVMPGRPSSGTMPPEIALVSPLRGKREQQDADAVHIAAWSPDRALAALDVIDRARAFLGTFVVTYEEGRDGDLRAALTRWDALR